MGIREEQQRELISQGGLNEIRSLNGLSGEGRVGWSPWGGFMAKVKTELWKNKGGVPLVWTVHGQTRTGQTLNPTLVLHGTRPLFI
jgi:D-hexose-6-phosphate mutarotase